MASLPPVPVIPIIGARKLSQLQDNLASFDLTLSADQLKTLDEASRIELGFPYDMYAKRCPSATLRRSARPDPSLSGFLTFARRFTFQSSIQSFTINQRIDSTCQPRNPCVPLYSNATSGPLILTEAELPTITVGPGTRSHQAEWSNPTRHQDPQQAMQRMRASSSRRFSEWIWVTWSRLSGPDVTASSRAMMITAAGIPLCSQVGNRGTTATPDARDRDH